MRLVLTVALFLACKTTTGSRIQNQSGGDGIVATDKGSFSEKLEEYNATFNVSTLTDIDQDVLEYLNSEDLQWKITKESTGYRMIAEIELEGFLLEYIINPEKTQLVGWISQPPSKKNNQLFLSFGDYLKYEAAEAVEEQLAIDRAPFYNSMSGEGGDLIMTMKPLDLRDQQTQKILAAYYDLIVAEQPRVGGTMVFSGYPEEWKLKPGHDLDWVARFHLVAEVELNRHAEVAERDTVLAFVEISHPKSQMKHTDDVSNDFIYDLRYSIRPLLDWDRVTTFTCKPRWNQRSTGNGQYADYYYYGDCDDEKNTTHAIFLDQIYRLDGKSQYFAKPRTEPLKTVFRTFKIDKKTSAQDKVTSPTLKEINERYSQGKTLTFRLPRPIGFGNACPDALKAQFPDVKIKKETVMPFVEKSSFEVIWQAGYDETDLEVIKKLKSVEAKGALGTKKCFSAVELLDKESPIEDWVAKR